MSVDQALLHRIRDLVREDKVVRARVLVADSGAALATLLARETAARGWPVDAAELEREFVQLAEATVPPPSATANSKPWPAASTAGDRPRHAHE